LLSHTNSWSQICHRKIATASAEKQAHRRFNAAELQVILEALYQNGLVTPKSAAEADHVNELNEVIPNKVVRMVKDKVKAFH
jgi:hypothetical protein